MSGSTTRRALWRVWTVWMGPRYRAEKTWMTTTIMRYEKGGQPKLIMSRACTGMGSFCQIFALDTWRCRGSQQGWATLELDSRSLGKAELLPGSARRTGHVCGVLPVV